MSKDRKTGTKEDVHGLSEGVAMLNNCDKNAYKKVTDNPIILDFSQCKYFGEIHKIIKEKLGFPDYYGENLDALWDCMRFYTNDNLKVIVKGMSLLPKDWSDYTEKIIEIFNDVHIECPNIVFEIEN